MIDINRHASQKANFTTDSSELLITYDVSQTNRKYEFENIVFGYTSHGRKKVKLVGGGELEMNPDTVIISSTPIAAYVEMPTIDNYDHILCYCLQVSKEKIWAILDKIHEEYEREIIVDKPEELPILAVCEKNHSKTILQVLSQICQLMVNPTRYKERWLELKLEELVLCTLQTQLFDTLMTSYMQDKLKDGALTEVILYLKKHYKSKIDINQLADKACMSKATFYRHFKQSFGITPLEFIHTQRINDAKYLLNYSDLSIGEISYQTGYSNASYFCTQFERVQGCSPTQFRKGIFKK